MVDGPNTYGFCGGDPVNRWDPWGLDYEVWAAGIPIGTSFKTRGQADSFSRWVQNFFSKVAPSYANDISVYDVGNSRSVGRYMPVLAAARQLTQGPMLNAPTDLGIATIQKGLNQNGGACSPQLLMASRVIIETATAPATAPGRILALGIEGIYNLEMGYYDWLNGSEEAGIEQMKDGVGQVAQAIAMTESSGSGESGGSNPPDSLGYSQTEPTFGGGYNSGGTVGGAMLGTPPSGALPPFALPDPGKPLPGNQVPVDLYAFGNSKGPRPPRLLKDFQVPNGGSVIGPETPPLPRGASTFSDPTQAPLSGHYHKLPAGTRLPEGMGVVADGMDVLPDSTRPLTHHSIYPEKPMTADEFISRFLSLPWQRGGKK